MKADGWNVNKDGTLWIRCNNDRCQHVISLFRGPHDEVIYDFKKQPFIHVIVRSGIQYPVCSTDCANELTEYWLHGARI